MCILDELRHLFIHLLLEIRSFQTIFDAVWTHLGMQMFGQNIYSIFAMFRGFHLLLNLLSGLIIHRNSVIKGVSVITIKKICKKYF